MGNNESSTPKLTKNSALSSPPVTPILPLRGKNLRKTDATNDSKNEVKVFMEDGNEIVEDSFIEDKENVDGRISRERSLVGTPISMNKLKKPNIFTPQTRKDRQNRIQRKHSNLSNASVTQDTVSTPAAPYESDSDSVLKARRVPNMKEDSDASIILDSDKSDSDVTLDEEDDVIKSEDDEAESGLDDSFIVDEDTEGGNFIESTQVQDDYRSSSDESFRDNDSIMIDESIVGNVPNASRRRPKRSLPKNKAKTNPTFSTSGIGSSQDPVTILPSQDNQSIKAASGESDSDVTLDEEDDVIKSGDDEEEAQFNDSFIVDDTEGGNFIESTQFKDDGAESDSILIDESIVENFPPPPRRPKRSLPKRQAKSHLRKSNPASSTFGSGSRQDPVTILPSQDFESVKAASGESDSDATLGEEDDVMESEDEEMSDNSFIVEDEEEEEDIYLTQKPTIQSDSDESFICDESLVIDESIVERLPRTCRRKGAGAGRNQDDFEISVMEDFP
uniref:Uncharacterized protein n=1 Tax=Panagrolaimus sp. ES5 TaxID=591445 RepID=A0AC34G567_9BILA